MSAGNTGPGTPDEGDDPFAYLYRPEGGQAPQAPRQPSVNRVRPVGERTLGGQQGGYGYPPRQGGGYGYPPQQGYRQPDAHYAAPENQPGGVPPYGPPDRRREPEPRRNGLLIGAIAVVLAVGLGVGAAIAFSKGSTDEANEAATPTATATEDPGGEDGADGSSPSASPGEDEEEAEPPATGDLHELALANGAAVEDSIGGARSADGSYIAVQGRPHASITWTFEMPEAGTYRFWTGYATTTDGQSMSFSVNGEPRQDPVDMKDYATGSDEMDTSWVRTYNLVDLREGENTIQLTCTSSCDVNIDAFWITEDVDNAPAPWE